MTNVDEFEIRKKDSGWLVTVGGRKVHHCYSADFSVSLDNMKGTLTLGINGGHVISGSAIIDPSVEDWPDEVKIAVYEKLKSSLEN